MTNIKDQMIEGEIIKLNGIDYMVPPLNLKQIRILSKEINALGDIKGLPTEKDIKVICTIVCAALQRNYPVITADFLEEAIDVGNFENIIKQVLTASGLKERRQGEAQAHAAL